MNYESTEFVKSLRQPGVTFVVSRMSFERRLELMRRVRALGPRLEYLEAGKGPQDQIEASLLSAEIDCLYLEWGLIEIRGLEIDGVAADPKSLVSKGPEDLCLEALAAVKSACRLTSPEAKN